MGNDSIYTLKAEHYSCGNGVEETNFYSFTYCINHLHTSMGYGYNKQLNINIEDKTKDKIIYQIDINHVFLKLCDRLEKATEFIRRVQYVNDWIEIEVNGNGVVRAVKNLDELKFTWQQLRAKLKQEYVGVQVSRYLDEVDTKLNVSDSLLSCVYTYLNFGLIFPCIPPRHGNEWDGVRQILFSEYENETIEEKITFEGKNGNQRRYSIMLQSSLNQKIKIDEVKGVIHVLENDTFPESVLIDITYNNGLIKNKWTFRLDKLKSQTYGV